MRLCPVPPSLSPPFASLSAHVNSQPRDALCSLPAIPLQSIRLASKLQAMAEGQARGAQAALRRRRATLAAPPSSSSAPALQPAQPRVHSRMPHLARSACTRGELGATGVGTDLAPAPPARLAGLAGARVVLQGWREQRVPGRAGRIQASEAMLPPCAAQAGAPGRRPRAALHTATLVSLLGLIMLACLPPTPLVSRAVCSAGGHLPGAAAQDAPQLPPPPRRCRPGAAARPATAGGAAAAAPPGPRPARPVPPAAAPLSQRFAPARWPPLAAATFSSSCAAPTSASSAAPSATEAGAGAQQAAQAASERSSGRSAAGAPSACSHAARSRCCCSSSGLPSPAWVHRPAFRTRSVGWGHPGTAPPGSFGGTPAARGAGAASWAFR